MEKERSKEDLIIKEVIPLEGKRLKLILNTGSELMLNMNNRLETARFAALKNDTIFESVSTNGYELHFETKDNYALDFSLEEALHMSVTTPESNYTHYLNEKHTEPF